MLVYVILISALAAVSQAGLTQDGWNVLLAYDEECIKVSNVDRGVLEDAHHGIFAEDEKMKVHSLCMLQKIGIMDEAGVIVKDQLAEKLIVYVDDNAKAEDAVKACICTPSTPEQTAFDLFGCYVQKSFM